MATARQIGHLEKSLMAIGIAQAAVDLGAAVILGAVVCMGDRDANVRAVTAARRRVEAVTE
jgi:glycine/D-amino acid oxidase-like deaminating enzyme